MDDMKNVIDKGICMIHGNDTQMDEFLRGLLMLMIRRRRRCRFLRSRSFIYFRLYVLIC